MLKIFVIWILNLGWIWGHLNSLMLYIFKIKYYLCVVCMSVLVCTCVCVWVDLHIWVFVRMNALVFTTACAYVCSYLRVWTFVWVCVRVSFVYKVYVSFMYKGLYVCCLSVFVCVCLLACASVSGSVSIWPCVCICVYWCMCLNVWVWCISDCDLYMPALCASACMHMCACMWYRKIT